MSVFCLLWVPLFYFLRRAITGGENSSGSVWALLLGSITAIIQFFLGDNLNPGGFGFSRWLFAFIDIVSLPVLIPMVVCLLMLIFRGFGNEVDFGSFALLWLIPIGALRALSWSSFNDPILLVLVPLLWTAIAAGIAFLIHWMVSGIHPLLIIVAAICILIMPALGATTYWAFFSQQTLLGFGLLAVANVPLVLSFFIQPA